jgi:hypothetical protein
MTIHRLIQNLSFNQDDIERLAAAYEEALKLGNSSDSVQLFEDRDNPTSNVFIEVLEGVVDARFTKTA